MENRERGQDEGAEQGQPRIVPTRPGWWWYHDPSSPHAVCVYVGKSTITGQMILDTTGGIVSADEVDGTWLAPIPGPAVLAALAEYVELLAFVDASGKVTGPLDAAGLDAGLRAAIRAERDGGA